MWQKIFFLQKKLTRSIPASMGIGLLYGYFFNPAPLKALIVPVTFLMVFPMMINLPLRKVLEGKDYKVQIAAQFINFALIPFLALGFIAVFFKANPLWALGLFLAALLPTSGMTISWTGFAGGNMLSAVKMTIFGLIIGSLTTPFYVKWFMGTVIEIPLTHILRQIGLIVFLPLILGNLTQRLLVFRYGEQHYQGNLKEKFPALSTLGVLGIVFIAVALKSKMFLGHPEAILFLAMPVFLLYFINFLLSTLIGKAFFDRGQAIALVYGTVMRNLSIALAIAMTVFGEKGSDVAMVIALAFIIQTQVAATYNKFTEKIFGPATQTVHRQDIRPGAEVEIIKKT